MSEKKVIKEKVLGLDVKLEIIKRKKRGELPSNIAAHYGIARTTVIGICQNSDKIETHVAKMESLDGNIKKRKTIKKAENEELDTALYRWFTQQRSLGVPISGPLICAKAIKLNRLMEGDPKFSASIGWLQKFKFRHGIRQLDIVGEQLSADISCITEYREKQT